ncbi:MAG: nucleotidyltransferase [Eubacterium sp.]|nr:nucleotidyltransferase [Eubacterium sp.]
MDISKQIQTPEYDFLRNHPRLGNRIILLGPGGSYAYGTYQENSDLDIRGITLNLPSDLLGLTQFEQYEDAHTDTVIYSFNKIIRLLLACNPNTIEILGLDDDQYLIRTPIGQELLDHKHLFLSKRAAKSFGGYAGAQLRRLQNAVARNTLPQKEREQHIYRSVKHALEDFERKNDMHSKGRIHLYIDQSQRPNLETEIFIDAEYKHLPLRDYQAMFGTMQNVVRDYDQIGKRNKKKDWDHLNKHAMHLIRLFLMAVDILKKGEIRTHRTQERELLCSIRRGDFQNQDGTFSKEFYQMLDDYEKRLDEALKYSALPDHPDTEQVEQFVESVNRRAVNGDFYA